MSKDKLIIQSIFLLLLISIGILSVYKNQGQLAEQGIYARHQRVLGNNLWSGLGYRYDPVNHPGEPGYTEYRATYPLWGYPIIVGLVQNDLAIEIIQVACVIALIFFICRKYLDNILPLILVILMAPVTLHASVKWADSWYVICLLLILFSLIRYTEEKDKKYLIILLFTGLVGVNFRPDFFYFIIFAFIVGLFICLIRIPISAALLGAVIGILPWLIYTWNVTGKPLIGSTNGGLVAYISLGQLPDNPWGRTHDDSDGIEYVNNLGEVLALSYDSDIILKKAFIEDVTNEPGAYLRKTLFNLRTAITGGVYAGEGTFPIDLFSILFFWILIGALITNTYFLFRYDFPDSGRVALYFSWIVLVFSLIWVSLLQYQPRHMNGAYVVLLLSWIIVHSSIRSLRVSKQEAQLSITQ